MQLAVEDDFECKICFMPLLLPGQVVCKHQFCLFCLREILYRNPEAKCALCKRQLEVVGLSKQRQLVFLKSLFNTKKYRLFKAKFRTVNHYDKNVTNSKPSYVLFYDGKVYFDIIQGEGSTHSSYLNEVARGQGLLCISGEGSPGETIEWQGLRCLYSNTPTQEWKVRLKKTSPGHYQAESGSSYLWSGWGRSSSGDLFIWMQQVESAADIT